MTLSQQTQDIFLTGLQGGLWCGIFFSACPAEEHHQDPLLLLLVSLKTDELEGC